MAIIPCNQLSLADDFLECQNIYESDKPAFLSLFQSNIDLDEIIPDSFLNHFYTSTGRSHKYPLYAFFWHLLFSGFFQFSLIHCFVFSRNIPGIFVNSVVLLRFLMLLRLLVSNRISFWTYNPFLITSLILPNQFVRLLIVQKQI